MAILEEQEFQQRIGQIDRLVREIEALPDPTARSLATELVQATLDLHGEGLDRILGLIVETGEPGDAIIEQMAQDDLIRSLLLLHGLHPLELETRVMQALDKVRPYLATHGGNVELLSIDDGMVQLRLHGSCHGCASSAKTLKLAIEEALQEFAPDIVGLHVEGVVERPPVSPGGFIPLTQVAGPGKGPPTPAAAGRWESVGDLAALAPDSARTFDVAGVRLLFCRVNGAVYAYGQGCPGCGREYDVMRAGRCLDQPGLHLEPFPLLMEQGQARVALPR